MRRRHDAASRNASADDDGERGTATGARRAGAAARRSSAHGADGDWPRCRRPASRPGSASSSRSTRCSRATRRSAAVELRAYLAEVPNSTPARNLLTQIETPLEMLYPAESFNVQLQASETLSSLAGLYLGDVLAFYGLARYNMHPESRRASSSGKRSVYRAPRRRWPRKRTARASMQSTMPPCPCRCLRPQRRRLPPPPVVASAPPPPAARRRDPRRRAIRGYRSVKTSRPDGSMPRSWTRKPRA